MCSPQGHCGYFPDSLCLETASASVCQRFLSSSLAALKLFRASYLVL